jgi:hypothetical protein
MLRNRERHIEASRGVGASGCVTSGVGFRLGAMALAVTMALGLSAAALAITSELASDAIRDCQAVGNLVSQSLLTRITYLDGRSGYRFLGITHAYALGKLLQSGEAEAMYRRYASYVSKHVPGLDGTHAEAPLLLGPFPQLPWGEACEFSERP